MGKIVYTPPVPHRCNLPYSIDAPVRSISQCDECGLYWECRENEYMGKHWYRPSRKARKIIKKLNQDQPRAKVV